jgi:general secretion pathway protein L
MARLAEVLIEALEPLIVDLTATFAALASELGTRPSQLLLCGGTARLRGLDEHLAARLDMTVRTLELPDSPELTRPELRAPGAHAQALAAAMAAVDGRREVDLRKGDLAYKADFSFLRARALQIAACVLAVLAASAVNAYASLYKLRREEGMLSERLKKETAEVFGQPMTDPEEVQKRMSAGKKGGEIPTVEATALDLLEDISKKLPPADKAKIDITELELHAKKSYLKGTSESASVVDDIAKGLESIDCFSGVVKGAIASAQDDLKSWSVTVNSRCP